MFLAPTSELTSLISSSTEIIGDLQGAEDLLILGSLHGRIQDLKHLTIAQGARVQAPSITATRVSIAGDVEGDITAQEMIELSPSARVIGNLRAPRILLAEGAYVQGHIHTAAPEVSENAPRLLEQRAAKRTTPATLPTRGAANKGPTPPLALNPLLFMPFNLVASPHLVRSAANLADSSLNSKTLNS